MKNTITFRRACAAYLAAVTASAACGDEPAPLEMFFELALHLAASGAAGGAACWYVLQRQARLDTRVRMS
ncbi:hypothetical protein ASE26_11405 [Duganella sp. Root198D2]|nr:hypothetical protein ASE26_11405 [Duganella sp. Root198D2]